MFFNGDCVTFNLYGVNMIGFIELVKEDVEVALISITTGHITAATFEMINLVKFPLMEEDYTAMMDFALDTKDKTWFKELFSKYKLLQEEPI
jgi:hypothetical protein